VGFCRELENQNPLPTQAVSICSFVKSSSGQCSRVHSTLWWISQAIPYQNKGKAERFVERPNTLFARISALRPRTAAACPSLEPNPHHKHVTNKRSAFTCRAFTKKEEKGESCFQPVRGHPVKKVVVQTVYGTKVCGTKWFRLKDKLLLSNYAWHAFFFFFFKLHKSTCTHIMIY